MTWTVWCYVASSYVVLVGSELALSSNRLKDENFSISISGTLKPIKLVGLLALKMFLMHSEPTLLTGGPLLNFLIFMKGQPSKILNDKAYS